LNTDPTAADIASVLSPLAAAPAGSPIDVLYFGGTGDGGGAQLRQAMAASGFGQVPLVSWDGLLDGSGSDVGSYINVAGPAAAGSYATEPSNAPVSAAFDERYRAAYGEDPDPYSGAAYACTQIFLDALRQVAQAGPSAAGLREAVRAYATDPAHSFDTILGSVRFDANGDSIQQFVTIHKVEMGANGGAGDWVILKQRDYGPPP
jgi:ABC-type branched-subunit amino acid transport system substrate-binding protein